MAAPVTVVYVHVDLNDSIGALQIGSLFAIFIFGIVTMQMYLYYSTFWGDPWYYKVLVATVWLLEIGHTLGVSYEVYHATIILYGQPQLLTTFDALGSVTAIGGVITLLVQGFFAMRLYRVLPKPYSYIGIFCVFLSIIRCAAAIYLTSQAVSAANIEEYRDHMAWLITALLVVGAAVDVIIAVAMLYYLAKKRTQGLERIASVIDRLIAYTIRTGLLTSVAAVIMLICFKTMPQNLVWLALYTFLAKLYSNSLLSSLNSRQDMRDEISNNASSDRYSRAKTTRRGGGVDTIDNRSRIAYNPSQAISIEMKTTTETIQDMIDPTEIKSGLHTPPSPYQLASDQKV
ncbi:hypothetical protein BDN70DRAFT_873332 [Pholiota conissans]|uniref:DUF6534 domain-containing protein n=1 Tax=Pholiota conissans TaxID=109636 RepID=A0A9P5Z8S1_9AGAR|nr:hypothetical protein BDN70DRAFT_873332 [Pholiota conissans]